jgi:hypothetical protein
LLEDLPVLSDPSSNSSTVTDETPSTPPPLQYYQPLFASVDSLVKQVAANTSLFGNASTATQQSLHLVDAAAEPTEEPSIPLKAARATVTAADDEDEAYEEPDPALTRRNQAKATIATQPSRNRASHPQGYPQDESDLQSGSNKKKRKIPSAYSNSAHAHSDVDDRGLSADDEDADGPAVRHKPDGILPKEKDKASLQKGSLKGNFSDS